MAHESEGERVAWDFTVVKKWGRGEGSPCAEGHAWFKSPSIAKQEVHRLYYHVVQIWGTIGSTNQKVIF